MLIDSHCHLHFIDFDKLGMKYEDVIASAKQDGVSRMLCVATQPNQVEQMHKLTIADKDYVDLSVGLHPSDDWADSYIAEMRESLKNNKRIVAIGEMGLDFYWDSVPREKQTERFFAQLELAREFDKPVIIHTRAAKQETVDILSQEATHGNFGVIHCFTEDWDMAKKCLDLGYYISISGIVTFKNADQVREVVKNVPLDKLLIETDCPYLAPAPNRGKINHPAYIKYTAQYIADLLHIKLDKLAEATTNNYMNLFGDKSS